MIKYTFGSALIYKIRMNCMNVQIGVAIFFKNFIIILKGVLNAYTY
jgi:hypothetical protein